MHLHHRTLILSVALMAALPFSVFAQKARKARNAGFEPEYTRRVFEGAADSQITYGWLAPLRADPAKKYPLVVCLHGSGGTVRASAVLAQQEMREKYPAYVMVPKAELPFAWAKTNLIRRRDVPEDIPEKLPVLIEAINSLVRSEAIDPSRVYVTGQSMGGVGSWAAIARHPEIFAAAVPVCGAWAVADVPKMVPVPVWAFHGAEDTTVPVQYSRDLTAALSKAGGTAKYTEYPGVGHPSWMMAYDDPGMWAWLFSQRKRPEAR